MCFITEQQWWWEVSFGSLREGRALWPTFFVWNSNHLTMDSCSKILDLLLGWLSSNSHHSFLECPLRLCSSWLMKTPAPISFIPFLGWTHLQAPGCCAALVGLWALLPSHLLFISVCPPLDSQCADLLGMPVCWAGNALLNYSWLICWNFGGRNQGDLSCCHSSVTGHTIFNENSWHGSGTYVDFWINY